jgi:hypothetical protein
VVSASAEAIAAALTISLPDLKMLFLIENLPSSYAKQNQMSLIAFDYKPFCNNLQLCSFLYFAV